MYDVIVLGLGAMGSAAAYHLAARGKRVLGLEKFGAAHDRGSSHGESRIIRQAYHEDANYVPLVRRAYELWERLERDAGVDVLRKTGGLMIGPAGSGVVEGAIQSAVQHGLAHEVLDAKELRARFPLLRPRANETAMYEAVAGYLRPEVAIQAHLGLAEKLGADLHFYEPVEAWAAGASGDGVTVRTARGCYQASRLVVAPGAWAAEVLEDMRLSFQVQRRVMCWFEPVTQVGELPIYLWDVDGERVFYGFPQMGPGQGAKAAMHSGGEDCTAESVNREILDADVAEVRRCLAEFIPALNGPLLRAATCLYTLTPDEHFVVARHPVYPQVSVAAGFSGHGFKFSSVMGEVLADLAVEGCTRHPIGFLAPERFGRPKCMEPTAI